VESTVNPSDRSEYERLRSEAIAALDAAESVLRTAVISEDEADGWSPELANWLADGMAAIRWLINTGLKPPSKFGYWLDRTLELRLSLQSGHQALEHAVYAAGAAVDHLGTEWDRQWAEIRSRQTDVDSGEAG
jgi:hypothetical protein